MNVLHLATFDTHGGAAVAALRLVEGLRRRGHQARLLVREKATQHPFVDSFTTDHGSSPAPLTDHDVTHAAWLFSQQGRSKGQISAFSSDLPTYDLASHPAVRAADVLHLHWVTGFVSAYELSRLQKIGKPIIWTLHDQFPFTGGCHYSGRCREFARACRRCPQLVPDAQLLASQTLAAKRQFIDPKGLIVTAPSTWMANSARQSALFRRSRIEVIPYGIDVEAFGAIGREQARVKLDLPADLLVILAGGISYDDPRKGHAHLVDALTRVRAAVSTRLRRRLLVLTLGQGGTSDDVGGVPSRALGALAADDPRLLMAFRAADVFVLPSLEDNLPNTLLESMAAGTPVVAYATGGIPDVVQDDENGRLVKRGDIPALAKALTALLSNDDARHRLGAAAQATARSKFDWAIQSRAYERLYAAGLERPGRTKRSGGRSTRDLARDPCADSRQLHSLLTDRRSSRLFTVFLRQELDQLQQVIAARGGEIRDHQATISRLQRQSADATQDIRRDAVVLEQEIAKRGGEIRELRKALGEAQQAGTRRKEVLRQLMRAWPPRLDSNRLNVGIFGVGESGRRVLEAAVLLDCRIMWLADNNADLQGSTDLGVAVIRPEAIPGISFDAVIIASAHRDAIKRQLLQLGVDPERIVAMDVTKTDAELFDELRKKLGARRPAARRA